MGDTGVFSSLYNSIPEVAGTARIRPDLIVQDVTMREGRKADGSGFRTDEKVVMAKELAALGLRQIQVGWPGKNPSDVDAIRLIKEAGVTTPLEVIANVWKDDWKEQIDAVKESTADWVLLTHPASQIRLEWVHGVDTDHVLNRTRESVTYATDKGLQVRFSCTDMTRTQLGTAIELYEVAKACGASRISISDTVGSAGPMAMAYIVRSLDQALGLPVHAHCHNELGLAVANSLAAVEAGAHMIDVSVNGLGDHGGNAALEELLIALRVVHGIENGVNFQLLLGLSQLVQQLSGITVPATKPVVGVEIFTRAIPNGDLSAYRTGTNEAYAPELVGQSYRIASGEGIH